MNIIYLARLRARWSTDPNSISQEERRILEYARLISTQEEQARVKAAVLRDADSADIEELEAAEDILDRHAKGIMDRLKGEE